MNEILLRRKNKLLLDEFNLDYPNDNKMYVATINKNIESLGFTFSEKLFYTLSCLPKEQLNCIYLELIPILNKLVGNNVKYKPMYINFPESVMNMDELELYINAIAHYWSNGTLYKKQEKDLRLPLFDETKVKVLELGTKQDLMNIFTNLLKSKTSISQQDKDDIVWFFNNTDFRNYLPNEIPFKENIALVGKLLIDNSETSNCVVSISTYFKTATDVLRLATCLSDGDISLADNTRFKSFKRKERRILMYLLEQCNNIEEDMLKYKNKWIRLGERIHPSEFSSNLYSKTIIAFNKLRNNEHIDTFNSKVEFNLKQNNYTNALNLLKTRAGELARKLDYLLRNSKEQYLIIESFKEVAKNVSSTVLLQVKEHFKYRNNDEIRVFFPKGNVARAFCKENDLGKLDLKWCDEIINICDESLMYQFSQKSNLGKVYLDNDFKNYIMPFSQRSASKSVKTFTRGSRIKLNKSAKALRGFIWWTNTNDDGNDYWNNERVDIDLSSAIFDDKWNYLEHVSYTRLRSNKYKAYHSGDITNGGNINGNGVAEFLDFDIDSIIKYGGRYVVFQVYNYTEQTYESLPNCSFGFMQREDVNSGEIFETKTVTQKIDLTAKSTVAIPVIFDCVNREFIWCDMSMKLDSCHNNYGGNNLESNLKGVALTCYGIEHIHKPNMYDVAMLNIYTRGQLVDNMEDADIIISNNFVDINNKDKDIKVITSFDTDIWVSDML